MLTQRVERVKAEGRGLEGVWILYIHITQILAVREAPVNVLMTTGSKQEKTHCGRLENSFQMYHFWYVLAVDCFTGVVPLQEGNCEKPHC